MTDNSVKDDNGIPNFIRKFTPILHEGAKAGAIHLLTEINIRQIEQDTSWKPKQVVKNGKDKLWFDSGLLMSLVGVETSTILKRAATVGVHEHQRAYIAHILEYGYEGDSARGIEGHDTAISARPLFRPIFDERVDETVALIKRKIAKDIAKVAR